MRPDYEAVARRMKREVSFQGELVTDAERVERYRAALVDMKRIAQRNADFYAKQEQPNAEEAWLEILEYMEAI